MPITGLPAPVATIAAGLFYTCVTLTNGQAWCWGDNDDGQLGNGTTIDAHRPVKVVGGDLRGVASSGDTTCATSRGGAVKCWGSNWNHELGTGVSSFYESTPQQVTGLTSGIAKVVMGDFHGCALSTAGGLKCWGANEVGQLGTGTQRDAPTPIGVRGLGAGVANVAAGGQNTCAVTTAGRALCWGHNYAGAVGNGTRSFAVTTPTQVISMASGVRTLTTDDEHSCAIKTTGQLYCWGVNNFGQLGDGTVVDHLTPAPVTRLTSGTSVAAAASNTTCAIRTGTAWCWGANWYGELGNGQAGGPRLVPVRVAF